MALNRRKKFATARAFLRAKNARKFPEPTAFLRGENAAEFSRIGDQFSIAAPCPTQHRPIARGLGSRRFTFAAHMWRLFAAILLGMAQRHAPGEKGAIFHRPVLDSLRGPSYLAGTR